MSLSNLLKSSREASHISQEEMADRLETTTQTISNWETGRVQPDIQKSPIIADAYGINRDDFLRERNNDDWPVAQESVSENFPTCLFTDEELKEISSLQFTPLETEFLQMIYTYEAAPPSYSRDPVQLPEFDDFNVIEKNCMLFRHLPDEYVLRIGPAGLQQIAQSVYNKTRAISYEEKYGETIETFLFEALLGPDCKYFDSGFDVFQIPAASVINLADVICSSSIKDRVTLVRDIKENGAPDLVIYDGKDEDASLIFNDKTWRSNLCKCENTYYSHDYTIAPEQFDALTPWIQLHTDESEYKAGPASPVKTCINSITASLTGKGEKLYLLYAEYPESFHIDK